MNGQGMVDVLNNVLRPDYDSLHHSSHQSLLNLEAVEDAPVGSVDVVVVPTVGPVGRLDEAVALCRALGSTLFVICSKGVTASAVIDFAAGKVPVLAVDLMDVQGCLPQLSTAAFVAKKFERNSDVSAKRNIALLFSWVAGWRSVFFLDDDIRNVALDGVRVASGLLSRYRAVGLENNGYPDHSVVCHAFREIVGKKEQKPFIGVGALAVNPIRDVSFFPNIYNQDWFYMLGTGLPLSVAVTGSMEQRSFNPYQYPDRARGEEFGDCLAEGLFWLLDFHLPLDWAGWEHWRQFLDQRGRFITALEEDFFRLADAPGRDNLILDSRIEVSLKEARMMHSQIHAEDCILYLDCWNRDLKRWREFLISHPTGLGQARALDFLGWCAVLR